MGAKNLVRSVCGSVFFIYVIALYIWIAMEAVEVQRNYDDFNSCTACLEVAVSSDDDFFFPMCEELAKNTTAYGTYHSDHEQAFTDGSIGAESDISYTAALGLLGAALIFAMVGAGVILCSEDPKNALSLKLSIFAFLWTIICLMFILDLHVAEEKPYDSVHGGPDGSIDCFVLTISYDLKKYNGAISEWMMSYCGIMVLVTGVVSIIAAMWSWDLKAFFTCAAVMAFGPGVIMLFFLVVVAVEMNVAEGWYMVILSFFCCIALGCSAAKVGRNVDLVAGGEDIDLTAVDPDDTNYGY